MAYGNGIYVAVSDGGEVLSSLDGQSWSYWVSLDVYGMDEPDNFTGLDYVNGMFVAIADDAFVTSPDGNSWTRENLARNPASWAGVREFAYGNGEFVGVGVEALVSSDGTTWSPYSLGDGSNSMGIAFGNGMFVAGDRETIATSVDGVRWTLCNSGGLEGLVSATYGNGTFVAPCFDGSLLTSPDGANWTNVGDPTSSTNPVGSVAFGNGTFVAAAAYAFLCSTNGVDWSPARSGTEQLVEPVRVRFVGGTFVAVGDRGGILGSTNGTDWVSHNSGTERYLDGVAYGGGTYVVVGEWGRILQSGRALPWGLSLGPVAELPNGACAVTIQGAAGHNWELQASTNLVNWLPLMSVFSTNSSLQFIDHDATNYSRRFYRALGW